MKIYRGTPFLIDGKLSPQQVQGMLVQPSIAELMKDFAKQQIPGGHIVEFSYMVYSSENAAEAKAEMMKIYDNRL